MSIVKIMNLSSGGILYFGENTKISEVNLKYDLKWDTTEVIGRMNGIKNYSNTTKTRSFNIKGTSTQCKYSAPDSPYYVPPDITSMKYAFGEITANSNPKDYTGVGFENFINTGAGSIDRFFYPSYQQEVIFDINRAAQELDARTVKFMQSAPLFFIEFSNKTLKIRSYCIIKNFNFVVAGKHFNNQKQPETFDLSFEIEEISSDITQISSMVYTK